MSTFTAMSPKTKTPTTKHEKNAVQFLQVENQIGPFIDITIASEMPKVGSKGK